MPRAVKILIVFGAIGGSHATGYQLRASGAARVFSDVAFFVGCLLYGAGIWLVAQIFHLSAHYPDGLWWWALGVLPFVLALDARLFHLLLASLLALWVGFEILNFNHLGAWLFGRRSWLPNGAYTLPLFAAAGLRLAYDRRSAGTVGTYVALLAWWAGLQPIAWRWPVSPAYFVAGVGGLFLLASRLHEPGDRLAVPYRLFGALLLGGALAPLSFYSFNADAGTRAGLDWSALVPTLAANGGMVLLAFGLMRIGLKEDRGRPFSAGVGYFLLWAVLRYFDLFGGFGGFLGAAGMFLASAAALFGMALYWRRRKETARA